MEEDKTKLKELSSQRRCQSIKPSLESIKVYARGWLNYYGIASMKNNLDEINSWLYHRIRMCIWKQWKNPRTRVRNFVRMRVPEDLAYQDGNTRRGYWFSTRTVAVNIAMTKERLINSGFYDLAIAYQFMHVNYWKRRVPNGTYGAVRGRRLVTVFYSILWFCARSAEYRNVSKCCCNVPQRKKHCIFCWHKETLRVL